MTRDWYCRDDMPFLAEHALIIPNWCPKQQPPSEETSLNQQPQLIRHADTETLMDETATQKSINLFNIQHFNPEKINVEFEKEEICSSTGQSSSEQQEELDTLAEQFDEEYALAAPTIIEDPDTVLNLQEDDDEWEDGKHSKPYKLHYSTFYE